jgi:hypothetical protein
MRRSRRSADTDPEFQYFLKAEHERTLEFRHGAVRQLLELADSDPSQFSEREWKRAETFLQQLHGRAWVDKGSAVPPNRVVPWPKVSRGRIREVHAELRTGLATLFPVDPTLRWERHFWYPPIKSQRPGVVSEHRRVCQVSEASWPDTIWVTVLSLLDEFGDTIQRCPVCSSRRLFVKTKRQAYCSRQCSQCVRSARWYQRHRASALEQRRQAYVRQVLKGRRGVVARRPRKAGAQSSSMSIPAPTLTTPSTGQTSSASYAPALPHSVLPSSTARPVRSLSPLFPRRPHGQQ